MAAADFDGDGKLDLAASNPDVDQVSILLNAPPPTLSVADTTIVEGNTGTRNAVFTVALTPATAATVTVDYATADGTATSGIDYGTVSGTLTFPPGTTTQTVSVPVFGDRDFELDETFFLNLSNPSAAEIVRAQGVGTIRNDDTGYALSVSDVSASEGGTATFTVSMLEASPQTVTVNYATADGTAVAGVDYTATSGTLTFAPGETSQTVTVALLQDALDEADETFLLKLSGAVNALITDADGQATIVDDDPEPGLTIGDASVAEDHFGWDLELTVLLSAPSGREVSVRYATADGTAKSGYGLPPGLGNPRVQPRHHRPQDDGDDRGRPDGRGGRELPGGPHRAAKRDPRRRPGGGRPVDDDTLTKAEITSPSLGSLPRLVHRDLHVDGGSRGPAVLALRGHDARGYGDLQREPGHNLSRTVSGLPTDGRNVHVRLWSLLEAKWAANDYTYVAAVGPGSALSVANATVTEGHAGSASAVFTVTLTPVSAATVTVAYATSDGTAAAGTDYTAASGTLTFAPQQATQTIAVPVHGDGAVEPDETFRVTLSLPTNATISAGGGQAVGTIVNDDPTLSVTRTGSGQVTSAPSGIACGADCSELFSPNAVVTLTAAPEAGWVFSGWGGACTGTQATCPVTMDATKSVAATFHPGAHDRRCERHRGQLRPAPRADGGALRPQRARGERALRDRGRNREGGHGLPAGLGRPRVQPRHHRPQGDGDDRGRRDGRAVRELPGGPERAPERDPRRRRGRGDHHRRRHPGESRDHEPAPGSHLSSSTVTFTWTAGAGAVQYWLSVGTTPGGTQIYDASQGTDLSRTVSGLPTDGRAVHARLWSLLGTEWAVIDTSYVAAGGLPRLSIADATVTEGHAGTASATFTVTLAPASGATVTVGYATSDGTATAGSDYTAASGTLTFAPQQVTQTITVPVQGDGAIEPDETFTVTLSLPTNATIGAGGGQAVGTIVNDDPTLSVTRTGTGQVTSAPSGIACGADCSELFSPTRSSRSRRRRRPAGSSVAGAGRAAGRRRRAK